MKLSLLIVSKPDAELAITLLKVTELDEPEVDDVATAYNAVMSSVLELHTHCSTCIMITVLLIAFAPSVK
jgi:hypothetical protein